MSNHERTVGSDTFDYTITALVGFMVGNVAELVITQGTSQQNSAVVQQISTLQAEISGMEEAASVVQTPSDHDAIMGRIDNSQTQLQAYQSEHTQLTGQLGHEYGGIVSLGVGISLLVVGAKKAVACTWQARQKNKIYKEKVKQETALV